MQGEERSWQFSQGTYGVAFFQVLDGKKDGIQLQFRENQLVYLSQMKNGQQHGQSISFSKNIISTITYWENGKMHGPSIRFNQDGTIENILIYEYDNWLRLMSPNFETEIDYTSDERIVIPIRPDEDPRDLFRD